MAYVTVPKDLTRVKSKIVFGLTKRQLICFGGALLVGVPLYFAPGPGNWQRGGPDYGVRHAAGLPAGPVRAPRPAP